MRAFFYLFLGFIGFLSRAQAEGSPVVNPISPRALMDCCWPEAGISPERVRLEILTDGNRIRDVLFETEGGASNGVARCIREVAFSSVWPDGIPSSVEVTRPITRPSGWLYLAHIAMLNNGAPPDRGLLNPAPVIRSCLDRGGFRPSLRMRAQTRPTRVEPFIEMSPVNQPHERFAEATEVRSDSERCVEAVLASTVFPVARSFEFDFSDLSRAPAAAPAAEVAFYFPIENTRQFSGTLEAARVQEGLTDRRSAISECWEKALSRRSELAGARRLEVRLRTTGRVVATQVIGAEGTPEVVDYLFDRCLVHAIEEAKFIGSIDGPARFAYTWIFGHRR